MTIITSPSGITYQVDDKQRLGSTDVFTLYECTLPDKTTSIMKIATVVGNNGLLDREAYVIETMKEWAETLEEEYATKTGGKNPPLNNHFFFPNLVETFIDSTQDNRRISVFSFPNVAKALPDLVPLSHLVHDHLRVDPRTSAWILGKLLKLLVFTHQQGISLALISEDNILINKKEHFVCLFNWTEATLSEDEVSKETAAAEITQITKAVLTILGASTDGTLPDDDQLVDKSYENFLKYLSAGADGDAYDAHAKFYTLIWGLWPREYHSFTTKIS